MPNKKITMMMTMVSHSEYMKKSKRKTIEILRYNLFIFWQVLAVRNTFGRLTDNSAVAIATVFC